MNNSNHNILCIIPARGGSKGVHRKNIRSVGGKPLIGWTIEVALNTPCIDRIIVSTDDAEIADTAKGYGIAVPFLRPEELARDNTPDMPVYEHTLNWLSQQEQYNPEIIIWLRPTSPLRTSTDIENAVDMLVDSNADWVRSVCEATHHPYWMYKLNKGKMTSFIEDIDIQQYNRRQLLPPVYRLNGAVDVTWRRTILEKRLNYGGHMQAYIMPVERSLDIDTESDIKQIEAYF